VTGNAAAALIISSNGQVAQGTISGHKPPSGDYANIIKGSISGSDLAPLPQWHIVGASGEPGFAYCGGVCDGAYWQNATIASDTTQAAFYRYDGMVFLKGAVRPGNLTGPPNVGDSTIFTLPAGFRPAHTGVFRVPSGPDGTDQATVYVQASTGNVVARDFAVESVWLDGISFRLDN
jgi:hypothetical protein